MKLLVKQKQHLKTNQINKGKNMSTQTNETTSKPNSASSSTGFLNKINTSGNQLEKVAHSAGEKIGSMASEFSNSTASSLKASREYIQDNPVKGVVIAASAGAVVGSLMTLLMRKNKN